MITLADSTVRVLAPVETLDYFDTRSAHLAREVTPLEVWNLMMDGPQPVLKLAFRVRDAVSRLFGVKSIGGFTGKTHCTAQVGAYLDFFLIEYSDDTTLVLTERDRHLDVMTCVSTQGQTVSITSSVRVHNLFGRVYMIPVGVAHKIIVTRLLNKLKQRLAG